MKYSIIPMCRFTSSLFDVRCSVDRNTLHYFTIVMCRFSIENNRSIDGYSGSDKSFELFPCRSNWHLQSYSLPKWLSFQFSSVFKCSDKIKLFRSHRSNLYLVEWALHMHIIVEAFHQIIALLACFFSFVWNAHCACGGKSTSYDRKVNAATTAQLSAYLTFALWLHQLCTKYAKCIFQMGWEERTERELTRVLYIFVCKHGVRVCVNMGRKSLLIPFQ